VRRAMSQNFLSAGESPASCIASSPSSTTRTRTPHPPVQTGCRPTPIPQYKPVWTQTAARRGLTGRRGGAAGSASERLWRPPAAAEGAGRAPARPGPSRPRRRGRPPRSSPGAGGKLVKPNRSNRAECARPRAVVPPCGARRVRHAPSRRAVVRQVRYSRAASQLRSRSGVGAREIRARRATRRRAEGRSDRAGPGAQTF
jgi:hypothetical protein